MTALCILLFVILSVWQVKILYTPAIAIGNPVRLGKNMLCTGQEALLIALFATGFIGLSPVLSLRLAFLEILCIIAWFRDRNNPIFSIPLGLFIVFLLWIVIGLFYTPSKLFGVRMILKYIYPFLVALLAAKVVRDGEVFLQAGLWARKVATVGIVLLFIPVVKGFSAPIFWYVAAFITGLIPMVIFSFALADFTEEKRKNRIWGVLLILPCLLAVFRTDIFGTAVALCTFFFVKYRLKSLPIIAAIGVLGLCVMFYVPSVKNKMFKNPDEVTMTDFLTRNIKEDDIETNMRKFMWEDAASSFYDGHEWIGSGTGRVQTFFYTEATDARRGGQLHNDFLVLLCDNGLIGLSLFVATYLAILLHCMSLYRKARSPYTRMCALVAGASLIGVCVTMYSDNTLAYSMVTLSYPWGFYGMALGLKEKLG